MLTASNANTCFTLADALDSEAKFERLQRLPFELVRPSFWFELIIAHIVTHSQHLVIRRYANSFFGYRILEFGGCELVHFTTYSTTEANGDDELKQRGHNAQHYIDGTMDKGKIKRWWRVNDKIWREEWISENFVSIR